MKFALLVLLVAVAVHAAPKEDSDEDDAWKKCLAESDIKEDDFDELLDKGDAKIYCITACVYEKQEILKNGELNEDALVASILEDFPQTKEETLRKTIDSCKKKARDVSDVCELSNTLTDCITEVVEKEDPQKVGKM